MSAFPPLGGPWEKDVREKRKTNASRRCFIFPTKLRERTGSG
jgi:hypothetical protein